MRSGHWRDSARTARRLDVGSAVPRGRHALVARDGVGWHRSKSLEIPDDVSPLRLPPYGPEPNPVETVVRFLKQGNFANQVFATAEEVKERVEMVWNDFAHTPGRVASLDKRSRARLVGTPTAQPVQHASPGG